jgi:peptidoglycan hydrolase-like protein with peptidoglycan-binding domain
MELRGRDLSAGVSGDEVALLHIELSALGYSIAPQDRNDRLFGDATSAAVRLFQQQNGLPATGSVDRATAAALTEAMNGTTSLVLNVSGRVTEASGAPATTGAVWAFDLAPDGVTLRPLGKAALTADGRYRVSYPQTLLYALGKRAADLVMTVVDSDGQTAGTGAPVPNAAGDVTVDLTIGRAEVAPTATSPDATVRRVSGKVYDEFRKPMPGLKILVYHIAFNCDGERLGDVGTGDDGAYSLEYQRDGVVNLQIRVVDTGGREAALSTVKYRAGQDEVMNLVCPAGVRSRASEHSRLREGLQGQLGRGSLADAREDGHCRDITMLAHTTGWDGRLIAIAAHADRIATLTHAPPDAVYALLRAGLPTDARQLAGLSPSTWDRALKWAIEAGVVELTEAETAAAKQALAAYAREVRLNGQAAPGTLSTVKELLAGSGLNADEQERFDAIVSGHDGEGKELWDKARAAGISQDKVARLQAQGKLAQLTWNNAPLIAALQQEIGQEGMARALVTRDFHKPEAWQAFLSRVGAAVPPAYKGVDVYAEDLARKVRISLPTHVVARRAETGEFNLPGASSAAQVLYKAADETGFRFGTTPTRTFFKKNQQLLQNVGDPKATEQALVTMHRVYQITPNDRAMVALIDAGITSADSVTSFDRGAFIETYGDRVGGPKAAATTYDKSVLVSTVVYNAFAAAHTIANTPVVYAMPLPTKEAQDKVAETFPTMEGLFGELDFCECEHCHSVLSPAAYFVDLLSFVDPKNEVWAEIQKGPAEPKPFDVLVKRRPDLPQLPLTCENTNTVLPYLDVVNEILEFSVAHDGQDLPAFDVGLAESDDLLAEPQNLISEAYPLLKGTSYPLGLPFDLDLETVRGFLDRLDTPLSTLLALLWPDPVDVHREELGLSATEYALFAAGTTAWHALYGYADAGTARTQLANAKTLARRLGVSYKELTELIKTWFVNPDLDALILLRSLGLDSWDLMRYMNANGVPAFDNKEQAAFEEKAGTHLGWLTTSYAGGLFNHIVVLADSDTSCSFDHTTIQFLKSADQIDEVLTRINLLVRLQRKLGGKLLDLDAALRAFLPSGDLGDALKAALVSLAHLKTLSAQIKDRVALLSLWSTMDRGRYRKLFLGPRMRPEDKAVFDDPHGDYLSSDIALNEHLSAVQGALNLTADEIKLILGTGFDSAKLSMATVTLLDRHKVLAKGLKLSIADLLTLTQLCGVDPFASTSDTLRFVEITETLKQAGFKVAQLDYLIRDSYDPAGPLAPRREKVLALIRGLATEINRIRDEHAVPADGLVFTDEVIAQKLPLVLPAEVAATFLGMWKGTLKPDPNFLKANMVAPVGFAASENDFTNLFPPAPAGNAEAQETWQRNRRAALAGLFLPFLQDRLIQTMAKDTLAAEFGIDQELMAALLSELLVFDGKPLLPAFIAANTHGLTLTYVDGAAVALDTALSATGEAPAGPSGTAAIRFSGIFEVPTPGPYAFAATAGATLKLAHLTDALTSNPDGSFDPVQLEAGKIYEIAVTVPGAGPAQLNVIAENLPLGAATRLVCRPSATVERIALCHELIRKALLTEGVLDLGLVELRHFGTHAADFAGWNLSAPAFEPLLRVSELTLLREELRASGEELIEIFREAHRTPAAGETPADVRAGVLQLIATLTRRTIEAVTLAADELSYTAATDFADVRVLAKLWRLLALAKTLGVPPSSVKKWANPAPEGPLAADVRTTLKARFEPASWRATVKPVSDKLRQLRRDALVKYLMHRDDFDSLEKLFEHFLVDPGTEPVVQTSRLRLAISSMQTFIQRCLMNLEEQVRPEVLSGTQWGWMKRYRVWEANRKIFLWPENWLEPEFRDDKSHLFQALEGTLLQGDVSDDAAQDALHTYLSGLDKIARLEIVSTFLQEHEIDAGNNILHVIGRTYNKPQEYFYRRFLSGEWTPWEPIAAQIESDHVAVTIWRNRPYLFWLTFLEQAKQPEGEIEFPAPSNPPKVVNVQLSWAEYVNGQWSAAEASDLNQALSATVDPGFDRRRVFMHAVPFFGEESPLEIYLTPGGVRHGHGSNAAPNALTGKGFRLVGRNAPVNVLNYAEAPLSPPFSWYEVDGTRYRNTGPLTVWHAYQIEEFDGQTSSKDDPKQVLDNGDIDGFSLVIPPTKVDTTGSNEIDGLVRPFFYQDHKHTFYVEPTVTEQTFHEWEEWVVASPATKWEYDIPQYWEEKPPIIDPSDPVIDPGPVDVISQYAIFNPKNMFASQDVLLAPTVTVQFGNSVIGAQGAINV